MPGVTRGLGEQMNGASDKIIDNKVREKVTNSNAMPALAQFKVILVQQDFMMVHN